MRARLTVNDLVDSMLVLCLGDWTVGRQKETVTGEQW